jgi:O-antigen/teichoic acid export membrane protein
MLRENKFYLNTLLIILSKIVESFISFFIIVFISTNLGAAGLGQYGFIFSVVTLFYMFCDLGTSDYLQKKLSQNFEDAKKYISNILTLRLILALFTTIIYIAYLVIFHTHNLFIELSLMVIYQISTIIAASFAVILKIQTKGKKLAIIDVTERLVALGVAIWCVIILKNLLLFLIGLTGASIIRTLLTTYFVRKQIAFKFEFDINIIKKILKGSWPYLLMGTSILLYSRIDTFMLGYLTDYQTVGYYSSGFKLIEMLSILPFLLLTFGFPTMSKLITTNKNHATDLLNQLVRICAIISVPITIGILFLAPRLLDFVYKFNFEQAVFSFQLLSISLPFIYFFAIAGYYLAAANQEIVLAKISIFGAILNIILNFALIPKYSLYGAAVASSITYIIVSFFIFIALNKNEIKLKIKLYQILIASLAMTLILFKILALPFIIIIFISGACYISIIVGLNPREIQSILSLRFK